MFEVTCTDCGQATTVPFKPTAGKPVYCRTCYSKHMLNRSENKSMNFSFNPKQAWARRGDDWKGRNEPESTNVFNR
ncbi:MAG TPA: CxxC-x17-CxxC domain-containing protein [Candidatus Bathyarchaeia archaeon]